MSVVNNLPLCYCRDSQDNVIESGVAVADQVQNVRIDLTYKNIGRDPALGSEILFTLPEGFIYASARAPSGSQEVRNEVFIFAAQL